MYVDEGVKIFTGKKNVHMFHIQIKIVLHKHLNIRFIYN